MLNPRRITTLLFLLVMLLIPAGAVADDPLPLAYCTDVSAIPSETWPALTGLKTLFLDALRSNRQHRDKRHIVLPMRDGICFDGDRLLENRLNYRIAIERTKQLLGLRLWFAQVAGLERQATLLVLPQYPMLLAQLGPLAGRRPVTGRLQFSGCKRPGAARRGSCKNLSSK